MGISNFINDAKEKRVNKLTNEEKIELLGKKKLDDYTLDLIIKDLNLDINKHPDGFQFIPSQMNKMSEKQNMARMLTNQFFYKDSVKDLNNHMTYTYCENRVTEKFGFEGELDKKELKEKELKEISVTIPKKLFDANIHSIEDAFKDTSNLRIDLNIQAKGLAINNAFENSGIIHIPNFKDADFKFIDTEFCGGPEMDGSWWYEAKDISGGFMYDIIANSPNISLQEKVDFMIEYYNEHTDNPQLDIPTRNKCWDRQQASRFLAEKYFDLPKDQPFITTKDLNKIKDVIQLSESDKITKLSHIAQFATGSKEINGEFEKKITRQILNEFNIKEPTMEQVLPKYLNNIDTSKINISSVDIRGNGGKLETLYLITTDDKVGMIYNPTHNTFDFAGKTHDVSSVTLNDKYINFDFEHISREKYDDILNDIKLKNSELSNDILENDTVSIPETNNEEKEFEI